MTTNDEERVDLERLRELNLEMGVIIDRRINALKPEDRGSDIGLYINGSGNEICRVPNGDYYALGFGNYGNEHPLTDGPYKGWRIIMAEDPGGCTIHLDDAPLRLWGSRYMFVGFNVEAHGYHKGSDQAGQVWHLGSDIKWWYTDRQRPCNEWPENDPNALRQLLWTYGEVYMFGSGIPVRGVGCSSYGGTYHNMMSSAVSHRMSGNNVTQGETFFDIIEPPSDEHDIVHVDSWMVNSSLEAYLFDCYIKDTTVGRILAACWHGNSSTGIINTWNAAPIAARQYIVRDKVSNRAPGVKSVNGSCTDYRSWRKAGIPDRLDFDGGPLGLNKAPVPHNSSSYIEVTDTRCVYVPPTSGMIDPATQWRGQHPYETWPSLIGANDLPG